MANIKVNDIKSAGSDLFSDSESYLTELSETELNTTTGGSLLSAILFITRRITLI